MASDSFTDTNGTALTTHDSNWADADSTYVVANYEIQSNLVRGNNDFNYCGARYTTSSVDLSQVVFKAGSYPNNAKYVIVRADGTTNRGYTFTFAGLSTDTFTSVTLRKNGTFLSGSGSKSISRLSDQTVKITASGTTTVTVKGFVAGTEEITYDDSTSPLSSGNPGFCALTDTAATLSDYTDMDDWTDGVAAAGGNSNLLLMGVG